MNVFEVRLTPEEHLALYEISRAQGVSQAEVLRYGLGLVVKLHRSSKLNLWPADFIAPPKGVRRYRRRII